MKLRLLLLSILFSFGGIQTIQAQTTFFTDDFEASVNSWASTGSANPNRWVVSTCTDNGGLKGGYITSGGTTPDCTPTGLEHYGYLNAASGSHMAILYRSIDAGCFNALTMHFDLQIDGVAAEDFCQVIYSTDNGVTWIPTGPTFSGIPTYAAQTVSLPAILNQTTFLIGFGFTYNDANQNGLPAAVDNVSIEGTNGDTQAPSAVCPASITIYAGVQCKGIITDIGALATYSDNCTTLANLVISQSPSIGQIIIADSPGTLTIEDEAGFTSQCMTQFILVDTVSPVPTCPASVSRGSDVNCMYTLADLTSLVDNFDECSSTFISTQNPPAGSLMPSGPHTIVMTVEDESGNDASCSFTLNVIDTIAPILICPASVGVYGNTLCNGEITDQLAMFSATDNCSLAANITRQQDLAPGFNFLAETNLLITATDEAGNAGTCIIEFYVIDTVAPVVTCLDDTIVPSTNPCGYNIPNLAATHSASEYCTPSNLLTFSQNPPAGTSVSGLQDVIITYEDTSGNQGTCITHIIPVDTQIPTISCPPTQTINVGSSCTAILTDLTGLATVNDNCGSYTLSQNPVAGTILTSGQNLIQIIITDAAGNDNACFVFFEIIENVAPQIICPANIVSCDPQVSYASPSATDNCLFAMSQSDATGYTSGSVFPVGITNQTYLVIDSSGNSASCSFTVNVLDYPDTAQTLADTIGLCEIYTTPIEAQPISSGTGSWIMISGTGTIADPSLASTSISGLALGTTKVAWVVSSASCGQRRDTLTIIVSSPSSQAVLLDTMVVCYPAGSVVQGNIPVSGTGTWNGTNGVTFGNIHSPVVQLYNVPEGFSTLYWTIASIGCPATIDSAQIFRPFDAHIYTNDTSLCIEDLPFVLNASSGAYHQSTDWSVTSGQGTLSSYTQNQTQLVNGTSGTLELVYTARQTGCPESSDQLTIQLSNCLEAFGDLSTIFTPNGDGKNDYFEIGNLGQLYPDAEVTIVNRWGTVVFESIGYSNPWDGTCKGEPLPMGTYFYSVVSPGNDFDKITGSISIIR